MRQKILFKRWNETAQVSIILKKKINKPFFNKILNKFFFSQNSRIKHHSKYSKKVKKEKNNEPKSRTRMCVECGKIVSSTSALHMHVAR